MLGHNQRDGIFLPYNPGQESEEKEEDSAIAALMRSTDEQIETNCNLLEMSQKARERARKRNSSKVCLKSCLKSGKEGEPTEQIQSVYDERLLKHWSNCRITKDNCIPKSDTSCLKLPCGISQPVLRDSSHTQSHIQERKTSHQTVFNPCIPATSK